MRLANGPRLSPALGCLSDTGPPRCPRCHPTAIVLDVAVLVGYLQVGLIGAGLLTRTFWKTVATLGSRDSFLSKGPQVMPS